MSEAATALDGGTTTSADPGTGSTGGSGGSSGSGSSSGSVSWRDTLPEDIRSNPAISSFQDIPSLTKAFIETKSMVGKKGVIVPGEKSTDEEWGSFYKSLGVPELDKYELSTPKEMKIDPAMLASYKEAAAKNGLLPKQAAGFLGWYNEFQTKEAATKAEAKKTENAAQMENLKSEWGEGYDKELRTAQVAVKEVGGDELVKYLNKTGLGNDVQMIKLFSRVGKLLGEDKLREGGAISTDANTRSEIEGQIAEIRANGDSNGFFDRSHPNHGVIMAKFESLAKKLTGGR